MFGKAAKLGWVFPLARAFRLSATPRHPKVAGLLASPIVLIWQPQLARLNPFDWHSHDCTMATLRPSAGLSSFALHARQLQLRLPRASAVRHASSVTPPKPRLLAKPDRYNPPSHPARVQSKPKNFGAPLSEAEKAEQTKKQYPHMMPPEGTFMYFLLTNRSIHMYVTIGILVTLVFGMWYEDFMHSTPYKDLLPPNSMFLAHPLRFMQRYFEVYQMHTAYMTQKTMEKRRRKVEDVQKRAEYRKAHGMDAGEREGLFGGWTAKRDEELLGPALQAESPSEPSATPVDTESVSKGQIKGQLEGQTEGQTEEVYYDFQGNPQPIRKKWLGIW